MKITNIKIKFIILCSLVLLECAIGGYIAIWREGYWDSLSRLNLSKWIWYVSQFIVLALLSCWLSGYSQYIINIISLRYRTQLTRKALQLDNHSKIEGGNQRVQEDCREYPLLLLGIINGLVRSIIMICAFAGIILYQLGAVYVLIPILYSVVGTLFAGWIAKPLTSLNYINQVLEAKFRQLLTKRNYKEVHRNNFHLFKKTKYLQYFQSFYNQIVMIVPHLLLVPLLFSAKITFGIFMQVTSSMVELISSLSFILNSFGDINRFLSCRRRLKELRII